MQPIDSNKVIQIGIVVKDIEKAVEMYSELFGIEKPNIRNAFPTIRYRGEDIVTKSLLCSFPMGNVTLELIQPDDGPSSWREFLDAKGEGVHHVGVVVEDLEATHAALSAKGITERQFGGAQWGSYCIVDSADQLGVLFNIKCSKPV